MGAVNVNERITFVKNVVLPRGKNNSFFFLFPRSNICLCRSNAPQNSLSLGRGDCGGQPQEEAMLRQQCQQKPEILKVPYWGFSRWAVERKRDHAGRARTFLVEGGRG